MAKPSDVSDAEFQSIVLDSDTPVLVDFGQSGADPARWSRPWWRSLQAEYDGRVKFTKVNVDLNPQTIGNVRRAEHPDDVDLQGREPGGAGRGCSAQEGPERKDRGGNRLAPSRGRLTRHRVSRRYSLTGGPTTGDCAARHEPAASFGRCPCWAIKTLILL